MTFIRQSMHGVQVAALTTDEMDGALFLGDLRYRLKRWGEQSRELDRCGQQFEPVKFSRTLALGLGSSGQLWGCLQPSEDAWTHIHAAVPMTCRAPPFAAACICIRVAVWPGACCVQFPVCGARARRHLHRQVL